MRKKGYLTFAMAATVLMASCEKNETPSQPGSALAISSVEVMTRAAKDTFASGDEIGIFVMDARGNSYNDCTCSRNNSATLRESWTLRENIYLAKGPGTVYAYHPYSANTETPVMAVESASQTDFLFSGGIGVSAENPDVSLRMRHALSLVRFTIRKGDYAGDGHVTEITMRGINTEGTLDIRTGELEIRKSGDETYTGDLYLDRNTPLTIGLIALPADITSADVLVTIDGRQYGYKLPVSSWQQGKETTYTLGIDSEGKTLVSIAEATIESWGTGGSYEGNLSTDQVDIGTEI